MRIVTFGMLLGVVASTWLAAGCFGPETPVPVQQAATPWPVQQAARVTYDKETDTFTLTNLAPHTIWYDGRPKEGPSPIYERRLPGGEWIETWSDGCGTNRDWQPLQTGQRLTLIRFVRELGTGMASGRGKVAAQEFVNQNGRLDQLPARMGIRVTCQVAADGVPVYSEAVVLP